MGRWYVLLVRKGCRAWVVTLSFLTAVLPGMPESMVESNDHVRAGAMLGRLRLDVGGVEGAQRRSPGDPARPHSRPPASPA